MTLTETLKEIRNDAPSRLGPDFLAAAERSVRELRESGIVERFIWIIILMQIYLFQKILLES